MITLRRLLAYWADEFDWRAQERELNATNQFQAELDGVRIHFVHERAKHGDGIPLILTHGWPSTFVELLPLVPFLTDPDAHGIEGPAFDVVIPSLPGYGFSERPARVGVNYQSRRRAVAPAYAWPGLRALRSSGRRLRGRDRHVHGDEKSHANDWHPPE